MGRRLIRRVPKRFLKPVSDRRPSSRKADRLCLDSAVGVEKDVSLSLLHLRRELLPKESNPLILDRFESSSLHISLHNSECSSLRTIQSHAISFPKSYSVVAPGMTWGPPSELTLFCLEFSSAFLLFPS